MLDGLQSDLNSPCYTYLQTGMESFCSASDSAAIVAIIKKFRADANTNVEKFSNDTTKLIEAQNELKSKYGVTDGNVSPNWQSIGSATVAFEYGSGLQGFRVTFK